MMSWGAEERRSWLFPPVSGVIDGIDLAPLDPSQPDERQLLIEFEHRRLGRRGHAPDFNQGSHQAIHQVVANQIWDGAPEVTWRTAVRLKDLGYDRHEVLHMIGSAVGEEIWRMLTYQEVFRLDIMAERLAALPQSWEALRQGQS